MKHRIFLWCAATLLLVASDWIAAFQPPATGQPIPLSITIPNKTIGAVGGFLVVGAGWSMIKISLKNITSHSDIGEEGTLPLLNQPLNTKTSKSRNVKLLTCGIITSLTGIGLIAASTLALQNLH